jgi:hypothetical protein
LTSISSVKEKKEARDGEVVRRERYAARPALEEIFKGSGRDEAIAEAIHRWGYKLKEVEDFLGPSLLTGEQNNLADVKKQDLSLITDITKGKMTTEQEADIVKSIPMGRIGEPLDVARACLFFASSLSGYITGEVMDVNGGMYID